MEILVYVYNEADRPNLHSTRLVKGQLWMHHGEYFIFLRRGTVKKNWSQFDFFKTKMFAGVYAEYIPRTF